jgi:adenosylhomocysteine nucleosidase
MICFAFPLAHEAELVLQHCTEKESFSIDDLHCTLGNLGQRRILIALIGMGEERARINTEIIFEQFRLKAFILGGYGGALVPPLEVGHVVVSSNYSTDAVIGFLRMLSGFDFANFCLVNEIVGTVEKRTACAQETGAQVADMETEVVANVVSSRQIPFLAVRVISDEFSQVLPTGALAAGFDPNRGKATPVRLLTYLALHPHEFTPFSQFVKGLTLARKNLTRFIESLNKELPGSW